MYEIGPLHQPHAVNVVLVLLFAFQAYWEKNLWIAAYMLVGALHDGCTVGDVEAKHRKEAPICCHGLQEVDRSTSVSCPLPGAGR